MTATSYASVDDWIARASIPCAPDDAAGFDAAVAQLLAALGDQVELLGFGEALHFGHDVLALRNRLFQRLVEAHGFVAIAIESNFVRARLVTDYIGGRGPSTYDAIEEAGFGHGFGKLAANRALVEWMRARNADPAQRVPLRCYGFDMPVLLGGPASPRQVVDVALAYLAPFEGEARRARVHALIGDDAPWEDQQAIVDRAKAIGLGPAASALRLEIEELIAELRLRAPALVAATDRARFDEALQHARVTRELLTWHAALARGDAGSRILAIRDALMGDNLAYIAARERGRGKVLVFAHNRHLQRSEAIMPSGLPGGEVYRWWPAGAHVDAAFGRRYAVIGSALAVSEPNGIAAPEAGTLEARLCARPGPVRFVPTGRGQGVPAAALAAVPVRTGSAKNPSYFPLDPTSVADFDALAVLDSSA